MWHEKVILKIKMYTYTIITGVETLKWTKQLDKKLELLADVKLIVGSSHVGPSENCKSGFYREQLSASDEILFLYLHMDGSRQLGHMERVKRSTN